MRIKKVQDPTNRAFWPDTKRWIQSRRGFTQFLAAAVAGFGLAAVLGGAYVLGGLRFIEQPIRALFVEAEDTAKAVLQTNDLPTLFFEIGFEEYQTMARQREEALQKGILLLDGEDWMRAQIRFQGQAIPVRIRLKGDWLDHLKENKWSFRVKTRNDTALMGMRSFSVQSPDTREFLNEWLYMEDLRRAGILAPRYSFVNVYVNGEDWGVYALEESFSKELLESLDRREGVIVRFDESLFWLRRSLLGGIDEDWMYHTDPIASTLELQAFSQVDEFNSTDVQSDPVLKEQSAAALGLLRGFQSQQLSASQVFDSELFGRYLAHTNLWGARHGLAWHNERYYYNPLTTRLEPIGYDAMPLSPSFAPFFDLAQYRDLAMMEAYVHEVKRISQPAYLEEFQDAYAEDYQRYYSALVQEFDPSKLISPWDVLAERQALLISALHPPQTLYAYQINDGTGPTIDVQVANLLRYPVVLKELQIGDQAIPVKYDWLPEGNDNLIHRAAEPSVVLQRVPGGIPRYITLQIPSAVIRTLLPAGTLLYSNTLQIVTHLYGQQDRITADVRQDYAPILSAPVLPVQPSVEQALERYPFLALSEQPGFLELKPGSWQVDGDLILPDQIGLRAAHSVALAFDQDAILFSNAPLLFYGPKGGEILLGPKHDYWSGLIVVQADPEVASILNNVEIRATTGITRDGWITTGGVTFYESPIVLSDSRLLDSAAEDAINVIRTDFQFTNTEFGNIGSDAFDGDFVQGRVEHSAFHDVRGDGIDVSGSNIGVHDVTLLRVHDKGISAGEGSVVNIKNLRATDVGIAIASKDMSQVTAEGANLSRVWVAGLAAFLKKMEYGPASIEASEVVFEDRSSRTLVQIGSSVVFNGDPARSTDVNVADLYRWLAELGDMQLLGHRIDEDIRLVGYRLTTPEINPGDDVRLVLYWQADAKPAGDFSIFVHIVDAAGNLVAQQDGMPRDDTLPTSHFPPGDLIDDTHLIPMPSDVPVGEYQLVLGMYVWQTGERLPVAGHSGEEFPDGVIVLDRTLQVGN